MKVTYKIIRLDKDASCMDVEFSCEGKTPIVVGVRWPLIDENVDDVIRSYLPINTWFPRTTELAVVQADYSNTVDVVSPVDANGHIVESTAHMQYVFEKKIVEALIKFGLLQSDPTTIEVTAL